LPEDEGVFSGFDEKAQTYDRSSWNYAAQPRAKQTRRTTSAAADAGKTEFDPTLQNPRCCSNMKHTIRLHAEMMEKVTGIPQAKFVELAECLHRFAKKRHEESRHVIYAVDDASLVWNADHSNRGDAALLLGNVGDGGE